MKSVLLAAICFGGLSAWAQPVLVSESKFFCKTEQFLSRTGKVKAAQLKKCSSLVEAAESEVKNGQECKNRAIAKGEECLQKMGAGAEQVSVKVKLIEKFGQNSNINSYTCEVDTAGNTACP